MSEKTCRTCRFCHVDPAEPNPWCVRNPPTVFLLPGMSNGITTVGPQVACSYPPIPKVPCGEWRAIEAAGTVVPLRPAAPIALDPDLPF